MNFIHLVATIAQLLGPGGARSVVADAVSIAEMNYRTAALRTSRSSARLLSVGNPFQPVIHQLAQNSPILRDNSLSTVDKGEKATRFGCGFLFGAIFGGLLAARLFYENGYSVLAATVVLATILGLGAMRFGDRFWLSMKHWVWWLS